MEGFIGFCEAFCDGGLCGCVVAGADGGQGVFAENIPLCIANPTEIVDIFLVGEGIAAVHVCAQDVAILRFPDGEYAFVFFAYIFFVAFAVADVVGCSVNERVAERGMPLDVFVAAVFAAIAIAEVEAGCALCEFS